MKNNRVEIAYIGGGSRGWARTFMTDLALQSDFCGNIRLFDIDFKAAEENIIIGNLISSHPDAKSKWNFTYCNSLEKALQGADFVVISILPGTFDEMEFDVHSPEKYGILQSVGDTAGPGGVLRAMRTVPMFEVIAKSVQINCPEAFVINFTNPMTICTSTLYSVFPKIKAFGCCHEVFGTLHFLIKIFESETGITGVKRTDIDFDVFGMNHFTWITRCAYNGYDLFPVYKNYIKKHFNDSNLNIVKINPFESANIVKMDLFNKYGQIAAAGDRHLVEFFKKTDYLKDRETIDKWSFGLTSVKYRKDELKERYRKTNDILSGKEKIKLERSGEEFTQLIAALLGIKDWKSNVNYINGSKYDFAPKEMVVEFNSIFKENKIVAQTEGTALNSQVFELVSKTALRQSNLLKACRNKNINDAFKCFTNEPLCCTLTESDAQSLFSEMVEETKKYLSDWKL